MTREETEVLIRQHLDGTLAREDQGKVLELLASSEEAREILGEYQKLDGVLKAQGAPAVKWDMLAEKISAAVDSHSITEEDEQLVSEYVDGTLAAEERNALEIRLAGNSGLRAAAAEYRSLDSALKSAMPLLAVKWDVLAERLSESIDADSQRERMFIGNWLRQPMRLAAAAAAVIVLG